MSRVIDFESFKLKLYQQAKSSLTGISRNEIIERLQNYEITGELEKDFDNEFLTDEIIDKIFHF